MTEELIKLKKYLDDRKIEYKDMSDSQIFITYKKDPYGIDRIQLTIKGIKLSIINGFGTYGGIPYLNAPNYGYLEMMINEEEPIGWLKASDVIKKIESLMEVV